MDYARAGARWLLGATAHPGGQALTGHVLDRLALPAGALVADVACGDGASLRLLAARGLLGVGVDVEPRALARARHAVVGDAHALPLPAGAYDAVLCECAISTFADPGRALQEMARVLRPGGRLATTDVLLRRDLAAPEVVAAVDRLTRRAPCRTGCWSRSGAHDLVSVRLNARRGRSHRPPRSC